MATKKDETVTEEVKTEVMAQEASRFAKSLEGAAAVMNGVAKQIKNKRFELIQMENRAKSINLAIHEAEKNLASIESKAQLALAQSTSGVRALADRLAVEKGKNDSLASQLKEQQRTLDKERRELNEMKAHYQNKLDSLGKIHSVVPGD